MEVVALLNRVHLPFPDSYSSEQECEDFLFKWRWPNGFSCPCCECESYYEISTRKLFECKECGMQVSLTSGTVMHNSKLPLWVWFKAIDLLTSEQMNYSALSLADVLGINYRTARLLLNKIQIALLVNAKADASVSSVEEDATHTDDGRCSFDAGETQAECLLSHGGNNAIKLKIIQKLRIKGSRFILQLDCQPFCKSSDSKDQRLAKWMEAFTSALYFRYLITW